MIISVPEPLDSRKRKMPKDSQLSTSTGKRKSPLSSRKGSHVLAERWTWRSSDGTIWYPWEMETRHLFFTIRMIWNNRMPSAARVGVVRLYDFSEHYTEDYLAEAILHIGHELFQRTDLTPLWKSQLDQMRRFFLTRYNIDFYKMQLPEK